MLFDIPDFGALLRLGPICGQADSRRLALDMWLCPDPAG